MKSMKSPALLAVLAVAVIGGRASAGAEQFVLFDQTFSFTLEEAVATKSHLFVDADRFGPGCPVDWTAPVDYRNGSVHVRIEVLEKPAGDEPTTWSLCYLPNRGQKNGYGCTNTPLYTTRGVYEKEVGMTGFWNHDSIIWTEGIKRMALVIKGKGGGKDHAHLRPDPEKFFPTRIRVTMVQVSAGATYDPAAVPLPAPEASRRAVCPTPPGLHGERGKRAERGGTIPPREHLQTTRGGGGTRKRRGDRWRIVDREKSGDYTLLPESPDAPVDVDALPHSTHGIPAIDPE